MMSSQYQQLTLFSEARPVSHIPTVAIEQAQPTLGTSGLLCIDWLIRQGHNASLSRMLGAALAQAFSTRWAATWKVRATKSSRCYIQLFYSTRPTSATGYSLWPTATASDDCNRKLSRSLHMTRNGTLRHINPQGEQSFMRLSQVVQLFPTLKARDFRHAGSPDPEYSHSPDLEKVVCWATLRATANRTSRKSREQYKASDSLCEQVGVTSASYLNPEWCELLMGLPMGWTFPDSPPTLGSRSTIMSRRGRSFVRVRIIENASRR